MKNKSLISKLLIGLSVPFLLVGCNNKNSENQAEQKDEPVAPTDNTKYDDGYVDGYLAGYNEGKTLGHEEGYNEGVTVGQEDAYNQGKEDGKQEQSELDRNEISIHTDKQLRYINNTDYTILPAGIDGTSENSKPIPLKFEVQESPLYNLSDITSSKLRISETSDFAQFIEVEGGAQHHFEVYNLKINTKYYYYYWAITASGTFYSDIKEVFVKNEAPRMLNINGVTNARDDGGWKLKGQDKYTKQGLIYRMARLNTSSDTFIQPDGIEAFKALEIKTEIDLRTTGDNPPTSSAVPGVNYYNCKLSHSSNDSYFTVDSNKQGVKQVLDIMGDLNNYPLMFHCHIGTDRTGFISFIVNALLGVEDEFLYRDYMMSNFAKIDGPRDTASISTYINELRDRYHCDTDLSLGAKSYMLDIGVSEENINNIKSIMLGA